MAAFTKSSSTYTLNKAWKEPGSVHIFRDVTLVLSTQGGATNYIAAAQLDLGEIRGCTSAVYSDNSAIVPMAPSYDRTKLLVGGGGSNAPQDISATIRFTVWGTAA